MICNYGKEKISNGIWKGTAVNKLQNVQGPRPLMHLLFHCPIKFFPYHSNTSETAMLSWCVQIISCFCILTLYFTEKSLSHLLFLDH